MGGDVHAYGGTYIIWGRTWDRLPPLGGGGREEGENMGDIALHIIYGGSYMLCCCYICACHSYSGGGGGDLGGGGIDCTSAFLSNGKASPPHLS